MAWGRGSVPVRGWGTGVSVVVGAGVGVGWPLATALLAAGVACWVAVARRLFVVVSGVVVAVVVVAVAVMVVVVVCGKQRGWGVLARV